MATISSNLNYSKHFPVTPAIRNEDLLINQAENLNPKKFSIFSKIMQSK